MFACVVLPSVPMVDNPRDLVSGGVDGVVIGVSPVGATVVDLTKLKGIQYR
jgi:hypothetical protein